MICLSELRAILKNKIRVYLHYNKSELIDVLIKRGLLPQTITVTAITSLPERENSNKEINPKYIFLKHIRNSPKKAEIRDMETGEIIVYSSMYNAAQRSDSITPLSVNSTGLGCQNAFSSVCASSCIVASMDQHLYISLRAFGERRTTQRI